tara:strand:- start:843 stop:1037 length:195 start_codon:yes stop_codon:yes gene_type:complete
MVGVSFCFIFKTQMGQFGLFLSKKNNTHFDYENRNIDCKTSQQRKQNVVLPGVNELIKHVFVLI